MTIEAGIRGPILDEARKGLQTKKGVEEGRTMVPAINTMLNALIDDHVLKDENGRAEHDGRGWSKITVYLKAAKRGAEAPHVNLMRHVRSRRVDVFVSGLDTTIHVGEEKIELQTLATVPQKAMSSYESMHIPAGARIPGAPPYETREATLEEVQYIDNFVDVLYNPEMVERVGNKLS